MYKKLLRIESVALAQHALGNRGQAYAVLAELSRYHESDMAYNIAEANAYMGNVDEAFRWLQTAYEYRDSGLTEIRTNPLMFNLHTDPRWDGYLTKLGLNDTRLASIEFALA